MRTRAKYEGPDYGPTDHVVRAASRPSVNDPWGQFGGDTPVGSSTPTVLLHDGEFVIEDDPTPSRAVKTINHTKRVFRLATINSYDEFTATNRYQAEGNNVHTYNWGFYGKLGSTSLVASYPRTISQLKADAIHKFHDANEVDTLLNLVESPKLISGASQLSKLMKQRKFALGGSSAFLAWSFGLAPLLADINKINAALREIKAKMDQYVKRTNTRRRVSAVSLGTLSPNISATGYGINSDGTYPGGSWWHTRIYPTTPPIRRVGVAGRNGVEYNTDAFKRLHYLVQRFVATGPASLGWELIPFSFMLDWFVNLSGVIDAMDNALTGNTKGIDTIWMSEKWAALVPVIKHKYGGWTSDSDGKQTALNELSYYHREPVSLDSVVTGSGRFGKKQTALTAALLHQIVASLRRR